MTRAESAAVSELLDSPTIVASITPCSWPPHRRYRSELVSAAPGDRFVAIAFAAAGHHGPGSICVELEQAKDAAGTGYKQVRGTPLPGLILPQRFDGHPVQFGGFIALSGEDLDTGYRFARVAFDVLVDNVVGGAFLLRIGEGRYASAVPCAHRAAVVSG
ncbi:MAG TPA: hypothetical protein VGQ96_00895 [Candidatus Eremiobacteraceae bacterium]|nr:hypothetical protein [Candidatus Eremiobacteraceae bacterium]